MHGIGFEYPLQDWFDFKIPKTKVHPEFISNALEEQPDLRIKPNLKILWLGGKPELEVFTKSKKGNSWEMVSLTFHNKRESIQIQLGRKEGEWLVEMLEQVAVSNPRTKTLKEIQSDFETVCDDFELFWFSKSIAILRNNGLLQL
jgi:hypothetical protein